MLPGSTILIYFIYNKKVCRCYIFILEKYKKMNTHKTDVSKYLQEFSDEFFCTDSLPPSTSDLRCPICRNVMYDSLRCPQDCAISGHSDNGPA